MVKKIGSVLICMLMIALCAIGAYADDPLPIVSSNASADMLGFFNGTVLHPYDTGGIRAQMVKASGEQPFMFGRKSKTSQDGSYVYILPSYTYALDVTVRSYWYEYTVTRPDDQDAFVQQQAAKYVPMFDGIIENGGFCPLNLSQNMSYSSAFYSITEDYTCNKTSGGYGISSSSLDYWGIFYEATYHVVFRTPDDMPEDTFNGIGFAAILPFPDSNTFFYIIEASSLYYTGQYDPDGSFFDTEAGKIIQGQKDAVDYGQEREYGIAYEAGNSNIEDSLSDAEQVFNLDSFRTALQRLASALFYDGTAFSFAFPDSGEVPFIGHLWDQQLIPLREWIDRIPTSVLYVVRFFCWLGLLFSCVYQIRTIIDDINGGEN